jgi:anti-anti-sigma regulatory factor
MDTEKPRKPRAPRKSKSGPTANATGVMNTPTVEAREVTAIADGVDAPPVAAFPAPAAPQVSAKPNGAHLRLNSSVEIKDVESAHRQLLDVLQQGLPVTVDISHVAAMDTAGVQLLLAFQSEAGKRGVAIEFSGQSTAFTHALTAVGLGDAVRHVASRD